MNGSAPAQLSTKDKNDMNKDKITISEAEWTVMEVVWNAQESVTAQEIITELIVERTWSDNTIKTLINRLLKKGALSFEKMDRRYLYSANVDRNTCVQEEFKAFLNRLFGGNLKPMMAHFLEGEKITASELDELEAMIEKKRKEQQK